MGKATRWLKGLLGMKKDKENVDNLGKFKERRENKRWSFSVSEKHHSESNTIIDHSVWLRSFVSETEKEQNRHAIAVAAATAAAADAAAAAAQAAVAVVRLTNQGRVLMLNGKRENTAAVKIQAVFRGSLSRKALRALKGLVKLQALVRGYLVRKRAAATLHSMQALFRAQFAVCSQRALLSSNNNNRHSKYPPNFRARRLSMEKMEECRSEYNHSRRLSASYEYDPSINGLDEIPSPKIIGIDTCKHKSRSRRIHTCISDSGGHHHHYPIPCPNSARLSIPCYPRQLDECCRFATAQNTPRFVNSGMSEAPATPTRSVGGGGDGYFQRYSNNYPSYMANTQSFEAKSRSHSAPKQRVEMMLTRKRLSLNEMMASRLSFTGVRMQRPCSQVEED